MYQPEQAQNFIDIMKKLKKKDALRFSRIMKKMDEILQEPQHYKDLSNKLSGAKRVHIDPYVLTFSVDEERKTVRFIDFEHHDKAYKN